MGHQSLVGSHLGQRREYPPSPGDRSNRAKACLRSAEKKSVILLLSGEEMVVNTYIIPDGHDKHHGNGQSFIELGPASDLGESVAVAKDLELVFAEFGSDVAAVRDAVVCGRWDDVLLSVLNKELSELIGGELAHDTGNASSVSLCKYLIWKDDGKATYVNFLL